MNTEHEMSNDMSSSRKLPSLRKELYFADLEGRPMDVALVRRWARQAGFVVRKAPPTPSLSPGGAPLFTLFDVGGLEAVDREGSDEGPVEGVVQFDTQQPDGVTLEAIAVYVIDFLREGCY